MPGDSRIALENNPQLRLLVKCVATAVPRVEARVRVRMR